MNKRHLLFLLVSILFICPVSGQVSSMARLKVSANGRFLATENGKPFFWLGDTGWLLFNKLNRDEAEKYLEDRRLKGFNVIQVMVLHSLNTVNYYGDSALVGKDVSKPFTTPGNSFGDASQYDFWDHVDWVVQQAAKKGIYMAMVPVWGSNVKSGGVNREQAQLYAAFLAARYTNQPNVIWLNGGDIQGSDSLAVWNTIGRTLRGNDRNHLVSYHPRGRTSSSDWFHNENWMDFNMFQSGHRRYDQDTSQNEKRHYGEDNWRYAVADYILKPAKPVIDGEPSYEGIPQGLHDTLQPRWNAGDIRRYGYWSVFAGGFGYTYGNNSVMQFYNPKDRGSAYGARQFWYDALNEPGARQMIFLKKLMLSRPFFSRIPDQSLIAEQGEKYNFLIATRGAKFAFIYTFNGRNIKVNMGHIAGKMVKAAWFNPRNGENLTIGTFKNQGIASFSPPGEIKDGNDWVLILDTI